MGANALATLRGSAGGLGPHSLQASQPYAPLGSDTPTNQARFCQEAPLNHDEELFDLETQGWRALSTSADAAVEFYGELLMDDAVMVFPGGILLRGKPDILAAMCGAPWEAFELADPHVIRLSEDGYAVAYRATAKRADSDVFEALIMSVYVRRSDGWQLALHQPPPV